MLIAEARMIARTNGDAIWPGFSRAPFAILLVGDTHSFLYCPEGPSTGFTLLAPEPRSGCAVKVRDAVFSPNLQATFPAVDGVPTVVVGLPGNTETSGAAWISTVLHEHFHQLQMSAPQYSSDVAALDLHNGDTTGQWMLSYPFPYERDEIVIGFRAAGRALAKALQAKSDNSFERRVRTYLAVRAQVFGALSAADARYVEFQLWQEGVARYSEIALAENAIESARRGDFAHDYSALAINLRTQILKNLKSVDMLKNGRVSFYAFGAGEALLLDRLDPNWRAGYFSAPMAVGPLMEKASAVSAAK